jgi:hypothetical protein
MPLSENGRNYLLKLLKEKAPTQTPEMIESFLANADTEKELTNAENEFINAVKKTWKNFNPPKKQEEITSFPFEVLKARDFTTLEQPPALPTQDQPAELQNRAGQVTSVPQTSSVPTPIPPAPAVAPFTQAIKHPLAPTAAPLSTAMPAPLSSQPALNKLSPPPMQTQSTPTLSFRLGNGKVGVAYRSAVEIITSSAPSYIIKSIILPPEVGISGDIVQGEVSGIPTSPGEFDVEIWYVTGGGGDTAQCSKTTLIITPDPKSLWKDLPSNQSDPYWKSDQDNLFVQGSDLVMTAASKRGRSHAHVGSFRDDDFHLSFLPEGEWYISIVSDGAGSAKYSRRGSQIICTEGGKRLSSLLVGKDGQDLISAVDALHSAQLAGESLDGPRRQVQNLLYTTIGYTAHHVTKSLQDEAKAQIDLGAVFKDYSSTAIICLCRRFTFGMLCAAYWVGDGAVAILRNSHDPVLLGETDSGEFSGQTRFIDPAEVTQEALFKRIRFELVDDFKALVLMTDGVSDPYFETEANLTNPSKWLTLWDDIEAKANLSHGDTEVAERLSDWLDFWPAGNHDDRTLAAIYKGTEA